MQCFFISVTPAVFQKLCYGSGNTVVSKIDKISGLGVRGSDIKTSNYVVNIVGSRERSKEKA